MPDRPQFPTAAHAQLGEPRDDYEREQLAMCEHDPNNAKLAQIIIKHLTARRLKLQH